MKTDNPSVHIPIKNIRLEGELIVPPQTKGIVLFAHGSGSSRQSPRNQYVAKVLHSQNIGTLLFDLLTVEEENTYETRFDIDLLTERLVEATKWLKEQSSVENLPLGYFGASTGAAAALKAAAKIRSSI